MKLSRTWLIFGVLFLGALPAWAQGTIYGVVTDSLSGDVLPGANVYLVGTGKGSATDIEGRYRITNVPPGVYTLRVSYLSYQTKNLLLRIEGTETIALDIALVPEAIGGQEIIIVGQAVGQIAAINRQLSANTIVNVVSEEKIQELPDANAAEALGRLPGVAIQRSGGEANKIVLRGLSDRFAAITIDGVRLAATDADARGIDLSTISQGSLAGIELYKALTPDKDADAIAGSVNLVTKKAPEQHLLRFDARGAYNELNQAWGQYDVSGRYGGRLWKRRLGVQLIGGLERRDRSREYYDLAYDMRLASGTDYEISDIELNFRHEIRTRSGLSVLLDFDTPDGGTIRFNNVYNATQRSFVDYYRNYPTEGSEMFYGARDRDQRIYTLTSALRGEQYLGQWQLNWGASYARSQSHYPFDFDISFTEPSATDAQGKPIAGMDRIPPEELKGPPERLIAYALNNFERAYFYTAFYREEESRETETAFQLDLVRDYGLGGGIAGQLKIGTKYRQKTRFRERHELLAPYYNEAFPPYVKTADGQVVPKDFAGTPFETLQMAGGRLLVTNFLGLNPPDRDLFDRFRLYPLIDRDRLRQWWVLNRNGFSDAAGTNPEFERNVEAEALFYDLKERISAAYVMHTLNLGRRVTLIAGLRAEREHNDYATRYTPKDLSGFPVPQGVMRDTTGRFDETIWLPNVHLTLRPANFLTVRLAAYKALARPDYNQRLPNFVARKAGTFYPGNSLIVGNPSLRAAQAWNYEVNVSLYDGRFGLFAVSAFYKNIQHMYHLIDGVFFDPSGADSLFRRLGINVTNPFRNQGLALTYPYNSTKPTYVWGLEIEHQANFLFLPGLLRNLVLTYNLSFIRSETYIPGTETETYYVERPPLPPIPRLRYLFVERKHKLERQPELLANVAIGYDYRGFSARISMFHQGEFNTRFSPDGRDDRVVKGFTRWDLALRQQLRSNLFLLLNVNNLTNVEEGSIVLNRVQDWRLPNDREIYGTTIDLGLRLLL
jgi:TonB-dependent receptor